MPCVDLFDNIAIILPHAQVYSDTKIRLHFSHFKILETDRDTCFLDQPHQCSDLSSSPTDRRSSDAEYGTSDNTGRNKHGAEL